MLLCCERSDYLLAAHIQRNSTNKTKITFYMENAHACGDLHYIRNLHMMHMHWWYFEGPAATAQLDK